MRILFVLTVIVLLMGCFRRKCSDPQVCGDVVTPPFILKFYITDAAGNNLLYGPSKLLKESDVWVIPEFTSQRLTNIGDTAFNGLNFICRDDFERRKFFIALKGVIKDSVQFTYKVIPNGPCCPAGYSKDAILHNGKKLDSLEAIVRIVF